MQTAVNLQSSAFEGSQFSDDDLSDEQVESLLQEAETRLKDAASIVKPFDPNLRPLPKLRSTALTELYVQDRNGVAHADSARLVDDEQRKLSGNIRKVEPLITSHKIEKQTAGDEWYDLPRTKITPQLKRDLQLLQMRSVLDPHRHYKKNGKMKLPTFSHVGTVIEGPTEYYSARLNKKDRKRTFVDEVMVTEQENSKFKRKYNDIQVNKRSGKKGHYKGLMAKRRKKT